MADTPVKPTSIQTKKRAWQRPEIVDVGTLIDLTEAVGGNVNDSPHVAADVTYRT